MLPIGDDNRARTSMPIVTYILIALNVLVFFLELSGGEAFVTRWAFVPSRFLDNPAGESVTLFTSMFMHAGWLHLGSNMLYLWIFGDNVEDRFGKVGYLVFYLLCGLFATAAQLMVSMNSSIPNLGASGAIAGVLAAYVVLFPRGAVRVLSYTRVIPLPALVVIGFWFILQLFSGIGSLSSAGETGGVAYMAHIGGFVAGLALTFLFKGSAESRLAARGEGRY